MRKILLLLVIYGCPHRAVGQERLRIDLDQPASKSQPEVRSGTGLGPLSSSSPSAPSWKIDFSPMPRSDGQAIRYESRLLNLSTLVAVSIPVSQDGTGLARACPSHELITIAITLSAKDSKFGNLRLDTFYGCDGIGGSTVRLKPGEWITYAGKLDKDGSGKAIRAECTISKVQYSRNANYQTSKVLEAEFFHSDWRTALK
jgi:hypothetical protein